MDEERKEGSAKKQAAEIGMYLEGVKSSEKRGDAYTLGPAEEGPGIIFESVEEALKKAGPLVICANRGEGESLAFTGRRALVIGSTEAARKAAAAIKRTEGIRAALLSALDPEFYNERAGILEAAARSKLAPFCFVILPGYFAPLQLPRNFFEGDESIEGPHNVSRLRLIIQEAPEDLEKGMETALEILKTAQEERTALFNANYYIENLMKLDAAKLGDPVPTGFPNLDKYGKLYPGLFVLAAPSSLGKTTFLLQMADQIAEAGRHVLFVSLEQSQHELICKSLARTAALIDRDSRINALQIRFNMVREEDKPLLNKAVQRYKETIGRRMSIVEGTFQMNLESIAAIIKRHIETTGQRPVVIVDYLQIIQPSTTNGRTDDIRMTVSNATTELKQISRENSIPIICVSAMNRASYTEEISFESLRESSVIEYTADVVWGLQLRALKTDEYKGKGLTEKRKEIDKAKTENPRKIELTRLKNRFGLSGFPKGKGVYFDYLADRDLYLEGR